MDPLQISTCNPDPLADRDSAKRVGSSKGAETFVLSHKPTGHPKMLHSVMRTAVASVARL